MVGNRGVGAILERQAAAKLAVGRSDGESEREADRTAELVARTASARGGSDDKDTIDAQMGLAAPSTGLTSPAHDTARGEPLTPALRGAFEERFAHDFSNVRVHHDEQAVARAGKLAARAFTIGADIHFGRGEYSPSTGAGQRLLAHELAHVVQQQRFGLAIQRQALPNQTPARPTIPKEFLVTPNLTRLTDEALVERHDRILEVLDQFNESTPDTAALADQAARIGVELARRRAIAAGRTFSDDSINKMQAYFVENANKPSKPHSNPPPAPAGGWQDSCIVALNKGMKIVTSQPNLPTTPETIEKTMKKIAAGGHSSEAREVWFETKGGKISKGGAPPERLHESIWDTVVDLSGGDPGWSVFTMSLFDGYHSVTLTLDANDPTARRIHWSDQWGSKGGWKEYTRDSLDAEVTSLIKGWWAGQAEGKKFPPVVRLWRVRGSAAAGGAP